MPARIINTHDTEANWYSHNRAIKEGTLVSVNDFNSTEHDIICRVESENLVPFPFREKPTNYNGVNFSYSAGTITATGTATGNIYISLLPKGINLEPGMYSISGSPKISGCLTQAQYDGEWGKIDTGDGATFEVVTGLTGMVVQINKGTTVSNAIFKPKLQRGVGISPFTPYISDLSTVKVDVLGANLIPFPFQEDPSNYNGVTFSYDNGTITATGTATNAIYLNLTPTNFKLKKGNYAISGCPKIKGCLIQAYYDGAWGKIDVGDGVTFEVTTELTKILIQINKDTVLDNAIFKPMLSVGTTPLTFEPYKKKTYTSTKNGIITGIKSVPPIMNFFTANANVILRIGYENWKGFIPKVGEQVIFLPDTGHASPRIKIGDGKTGVNGLPFATDTSLSISGAAADAGKVGEKISILEGNQKKYLPLTGGTITGQISKTANAAGWYNGRDVCLIKGAATDSTHFFPLLSSKTLKGSFEIGGYQNQLLISYVTDADYNAETNNHSSTYFDEDCILHGTTTAVGTSTLKLYAEKTNEINFGGTGASDTIYFGTRETDGRARPTTYSFGPSSSATIRAATFSGTATSVSKTWILSNVYPIGSIYMSTKELSPASFLGGKWERIYERFLLAANSYYTAGSTGGEKYHALTKDELPRHEGHLYSNNENWGGNAIGAYLSGSSMNSYGTTPRGWNLQADSEYVPAGHTVGADEGHNNMPPYLAVYMWKRIG